MKYQKGLLEIKTANGTVCLGSINEKWGHYWFNPHVAGRKPSRKLWANPIDCVPLWAKKMVKAADAREHAKKVHAEMAMQSMCSPQTLAKVQPVATELTQAQKDAKYREALMGAVRTKAAGDFRFACINNPPLPTSYEQLGKLLEEYAVTGAAVALRHLKATGKLQ